MWLNPAHSLPLLSAQIRADGWSDVVHSWQNPARSLSASTVLLLLAGLVLVVVSAMWWWERRRSRHLRSHPLELFEQLAQELGLAWSDRRLLIRVARRQGLPSPLTLMLSPATLAHHARHYGATRSARRRAAIEARMARIAQALFDAPQSA